MLHNRQFTMEKEISKVHIIFFITVTVMVQWNIIIKHSLWFLELWELTIIWNKNFKSNKENESTKST